MKNISILLIAIVLIVPISLSILPRPAHALFGAGDVVTDPLDIAQNTISAAANPLTAAATTWTQIKGSVLDPLAHALAQLVLKEVTASVVNSINGKNGSPQFVQSLGINLQTVGDQVGLSFISQFGSSINSPFSASIASALQTNYLQGTSLAGFFAANQCTLTQSSSNINSFLAGNFSQGGWGAWFSLTTQDQNNPFTLYQKTSGQLASVVAGAQANQRQTIAQNNGFLSWCSSGSTDTSGSGLGKSCSDFTNSSDCNGSLVCIQTAGQTTGTCQQPTAATSNDTASTCYNSDGTPGTVQTPGSVIEATLNKSLGSGIDSLVSVHDFDQMVDTVLSALATQVVSGTLAGLSSGGSNSYTAQLASGTSTTDPNAASLASQATLQAQAELTQLGSYTSAWQTIQTAANTASANVTQLMGSCPSLTNPVQTAILTEIQPVLNRAQAAFSSASTTQQLAIQVENDAAAYSAGSAAAAGALSADTQALSAAPPLVSDVASAQANATVTNGATSTSSYVLTVSGGTLVDQMNLISANAQTELPTCGQPFQR